MVVHFGAFVVKLLLEETLSPINQNQTLIGSVILKRCSDALSSSVEKAVSRNTARDLGLVLCRDQERRPTT